MFHKQTSIYIRGADCIFFRVFKEKSWGNLINTSDASVGILTLRTNNQGSVLIKVRCLTFYSQTTSFHFHPLPQKS